MTRAQVIALLQPHRTLLLSSENFSYLNLEELHTLKAALPDTDVQIVCFVRTPIDLWPSHWQELIRHGRDTVFMDYIAAFAGWRQTHPANIMNPAVLATKFANVFGEDSLRLFCYDNALRTHGDILDFFVPVVLGITAPIPTAERRQSNASMPLHTVEMLRCLNGEGAGATVAEARALIRAYLDQLPTLEQQPDHAAFVAAFEANGALATLDSGHEFQRIRERQFMNRYAGRVENKASPNRLFLQERFSRSIRYGERHWIYRHGMQPYVSELRRQLQSTTLARTGAEPVS